jgi:branched-subunit amino acid aminotransferase/4-amino-4-deoxychorismate lyase
MYLQRLAENCERLRIVAPARGFRAKLEEALRGWTPPALPPDEQGQGLFRVEWTTEGVMNLAGRILPTIPQAKRAALEAVSLPAPWWKESGVTGTKHAAWSPYLDAMHRASAQGGYCALLVDPDGAVVDGDRVTPILAERGGGNTSKIVLRYPPKHAGAVESVTIRALRQVLERLKSDEQEGPNMVLQESSFNLRDVQATASQALLVVGSGVGVGNVAQLNGSPVGVTNDAGKIYAAVASCLSKAREDGWEVVSSCE